MKVPLARFHSACGNIDRRSFLADCGMGFTGLALGALLGRDGYAATTEEWTPPDGKPHFAPKAKRVIWLFMVGGTSHVDTFDPKSALNQYAGKTIAETPHKGVLDVSFVTKNVRNVASDTNISIRNTLYPMQVDFRKGGQSGIEVTDWWPNVRDCIDDVAVIRSMWTSFNDHGAILEAHTGRHIFDGFFPTVGSWVHYGLGSLNENLPAFVVLGAPPLDSTGGVQVYGADYLGPEHAGVHMEMEGDEPLPYASPGPSEYKEEQEREFGLINRLNQASAVRYPSDPDVKARIKAYELAFRMQLAVPDALRLKEESEETKRLYGLDNKLTEPFGSTCLAARRLSERGVRFVQVLHGGGQGLDWDAHSNLKTNHADLCAKVDRPIAGLLRDLKQRGLLQDTVVVWTTEFGRSPGSQGANGRDHHPYGFSAWMAGGGLKGGLVNGATDELGFHAVENRHYVTDIHATVLHQLGLDPKRLVVPGHKRLDIELGTPIREIIA
jgi:hypothetical protein